MPMIISALSRLNRRARRSAVAADLIGNGVSTSRLNLRKRTSGSGRGSLSRLEEDVRARLTPHGAMYRYHRFETERAKDRDTIRNQERLYLYIR